MSVALRRQGWLFVAIAILVVAVQALAPVGDRHLQLAVLGGLVVLLGAPHGALDPVYVKDYVGPKGWTGWLLFSLAYLTLSLGVVAGRAALDADAASFRRGFVSADDNDGKTYLDCLAPVPGEDRVMDVGYGPGGDLGRSVLTR